MSISPHSSRSLGRSIGAFSAGFFFVAIFSTGTDQIMHGTGIFPPSGRPMATGLWVLATAYRLVYQVIGGYLTAHFARIQPMKLVKLQAWVGTFLCLLGVVLTWHMGPEFGPKWYPLTLLVTAFPSVWMGGNLQARRASSLS